MRATTSSSSAHRETFLEVGGTLVDEQPDVERMRERLRIIGRSSDPDRVVGQLQPSIELVGEQQGVCEATHHFRDEGVATSEKSCERLLEQGDQFGVGSGPSGHRRFADRGASNAVRVVLQSRRGRCCVERLEALGALARRRQRRPELEIQLRRERIGVDHVESLPELRSRDGRRVPRQGVTSGPQGRLGDPATGNAWHRRREVSGDLGQSGARAAGRGERVSDPNVELLALARRKPIDECLVQQIVVEAKARSDHGDELLSNSGVRGSCDILERQPGGVSERLETDLAACDRSDLEHSSSIRIELIDPAQQNVAHEGRERDAAELVGIEPFALRLQQAYELAHQQWVGAGPIVDRCCEVVGDRMADLGADHLLQRRTRQPSEVHDVGGASEVDEQPAHIRCVRRLLVGPHREDEQDRQTSQLAGAEPQGCERIEIRPVEVVDHHHPGMLEPRTQGVDDRLVNPDRRGVVGPLQRGRGVGGQVDPQRTADRPPRPQRRRIRSGARSPRHDGPIIHRPHVRGQIFDEMGLADPRVATHGHHASSPVADVVPQLTKFAALLIPADDEIRRVRMARRHRSSISHLSVTRSRRGERAKAPQVAAPPCR